jgi:ribonuclease P protein component
MSEAPKGASFSKARRLLHRRDFQFAAAAKVRSAHFLFVFAKNGQGRLGLSISRRVVPGAVGRNRVRRLLREAFRRDVTAFEGVDVNVVGLASLGAHWRSLRLEDVRGAVGVAAKTARSLSSMANVRETRV